LVFLGMSKADAVLTTIIPTNPVHQRVEIEAKYNSFYATKLAVNESESQFTTVRILIINNDYEILNAIIYIEL